MTNRGPPGFPVNILMREVGSHVRENFLDLDGQYPVASDVVHICTIPVKQQDLSHTIQYTYKRCTQFSGGPL